MKYTIAEITFREFPDEISLCINISNCPFHCKGCHSPELWEDIGTELTRKEVKKLIDSNKGITCIGFMGGTPSEINDLVEYVKTIYSTLKTGWYWGGNNIPSEINLIKNLDYIKIGPFIKNRGPLDNPNTNQKMYQISKMETGEYIKEDITFKFWSNE